MLRVNQRRTKSARSKRLLLAAIAAVVVVAVIAGLLAMRSKADTQPGSATLVLGQGSGSSQSIRLETVTTEAAQEKGLSGRAGLAKNTGMLFSYDEQKQHCMWMKDMRFNLDMVWIDKDKRITSLVSNITPATYPQSYCAPSKYVVELNAGDVRAYGLRVGQFVQL